MKLYCYVTLISLLVGSSAHGSCLKFQDLMTGKPLVMEEAKYFKAIKHTEGLLLTVEGPHLGAKRPKYYLLQRGDKKLCPDSNIRSLKLPLKKLAAMSTTHVSPLAELGVSDTLVGFGNTRFIHSREIRERIKAKKVREIGVPPSPEILTKLRPDAMMVFSVSSPEIEGIRKLEKLGLPVIYNSDYLETSPLARAEWIVFFGLLYEKEKEAREIFAGIKNRYHRLKSLTKSVKRRPIVAVGKNNHGIWIAPGGDSDLAQMIKDAGGEYLWNSHRGRKQVRLSLEKAFTELQKVDIWLPQNTWNNLKEASLEEPRYEKIPVFQKKAVFNNNKRVNSAGGNDYWERGVMRPDLLLEDLVRAFHPGLLPEAKLHWYKKLK